MTAYRVVWDETWQRTMDVVLDEDDLRSWAHVPIGPLTERMICAYLEEEVWDHGAWHPNSRPGQRSSDEVADLDVQSLRDPTTEGDQ